MSGIEFGQIDPSKIHPVQRYGYDPLPFNRGDYVWVEESQTWEPGTYTHAYDVATGVFKRTGYKLKGSYGV